ncbi:TPA: hypothetical protein N0F65_011407 [Lagenidium giganteum]|uniref:Cyclic nucleotide-binding domain-containing protein n=1 Tax=Lagenidium giganteum TaxID=4803 RepID=A0AAV2Z7Z9_9STRA|nr:TPA: hypothetical protein N0F65_011407 [Lagenidium giganteum]
MKNMQTSVFVLAKEQGLYSRIILRCSQFYSHRLRWPTSLFPIVDPRSNGKLVWDSIIMNIIIYTAVVVPLEIGFPDLKFGSGWTKFNVTTDVLCCLDVIHHFTVGYYDLDDDYVMVTDRKAIAKRYLKTWFVFDFFASMPTEFIAAAFPTIILNDKSVMSLKLARILRLIRMAKLVRLLKVRQFVIKLEDALELNAVFMRLSSTILQALLLAHILTCFWHFVGFSDDTTSVTWISELNTSYNGTSTRYLYSAYWAIATLTTVGYGDIHATNTDERLYSIMTALVGASMFGILIGSITKILANWNREATTKVRKLCMVEAFSERKKIPRHLRSKLSRYFRHFIARTSAFDERSLLYEFSLSLRSEVLQETYQTKFFSIPAFTSLSTQFIIDMAMYIKPLIAVRGEVFAEEHSVGTEMYILNQGIVEVTRRTVGDDWLIILEVLAKRGIFGESSLLNYTQHQNTYTAKDTCDLYSLPKEDFDRLIEEFPDAENTLLVYHQQRQQLCTLVVEQTIARYQAFVKMRTNDLVSGVTGIENMYPSLTVLLDGELRSYQSIPSAVLRKMTLELSMGVSVFNSVKEKQKAITMLASKDDWESDSLGKLLTLPLTPDGNFKRRWDICISALLLYCAMSVPFEISFLGEEIFRHPNLLIAEAFVEVAFAIDILINLRTGFYDDSGCLVMDQMRIAEAYMKSWLCIDLLSVFPVSQIISTLVINQSGSRQFILVRVVRLFKLARLLKLIRTFSRVEQTAGSRQMMARVLRLIYRAIFSAHVLTCGYYYVASVSASAYDQASSEVIPGVTAMFETYVYCFYWAITTMTTTGYGDTPPSNPAEVTFAIVGLLIGASTFAYIVGTLSSIVDDLHANDDFFRERMDRHKAYLKERHISKPLAARLRRYYEYYLVQRNDKDEQEILMSLSDNLRTQLIMHMNRDVVSKMSFFASRDDTCVSYLMNILEPEFCTPGEFVFKEGQVGRHMYFLTKGKADILFHAQTSKEIAVATLVEGNYFGEIAMLTMSKRAASVRARTHLSMFTLSRPGLDRVSLHYPEMADSIIQEFRHKIKDIKQTNATRQLGPVVQEDIRAARVHSTLLRGGNSAPELQQHLVQLEGVVSRMVAIFGNDSKSKHKALACVMQHLRKFEFSLDDLLMSTEEFSNFGGISPARRSTANVSNFTSLVLATLACSRRSTKQSLS